MKSFIVLFAAVAAVHGNSLICRNYRNGALLPNPENCAQFFMCRPGRAVKFTCPEYTRFNPVLQACDPTDSVRCKPGKLPVDLEYTPIDAMPSKILHTNTACINRPVATLLAKPSDCSSFYQCSPNGVIEFQCPAGTLFDTNRKFCERNDVASCGASVNPAPIFPGPIPIVPPVNPNPLPPPVTNEDPALARCQGQREGAKLRHPSSCTQYILCSSQGRSQVFSCPAGTAYDEKRMVCDWASSVKCVRSE
ncbi:conserved hypothetical protein [Culex quinquefasciatus]|uniref:Chitin-binding type-2 domain-containing protein n=1 Tax=Culex quinquefasciatus TaxID=7176 RepID=B0W8E0_CULQU|nr:conserved hypothetical protein [Culex quinquefasciatus]|eukprot:XP_001844974.1 conserved hypothetical protein [Culex quinquefasciatus]